MLSDYQLKAADLCNIPIDNVKKLVSKVRDSLWKLTTLLKIRIDAKKIYRILEFNQLIKFVS